MVQYISEQNQETIANVALQLTEISGAMLFLGSKASQETLLTCAQFIDHALSQSTTLNPQQIQSVLEVLASADMMIENLQNKQPVLQSMFDIALKSSQNLKAIA